MKENNVLVLILVPNRAVPFRVEWHSIAKRISELHIHGISDLEFVDSHRLDNIELRGSPPRHGLCWEFKILGAVLNLER